MLKNYFRVALRNFWHNRAFSAINILGLAIGISASLIIYLLVYYDFTFDKFEKDRDRIYRVVATGSFQGNTWHNNCLTEPTGPAVEKNLSGIEVVAPFTTADEMRVTIPSQDAGQPRVFRKQKDAVYVDKRYFDLIRYTWLAGSPIASLQQPYQVVLTEKNARLYFPKLKDADIPRKSASERSSAPPLHRSSCYYQGTFSGSSGLPSSSPFQSPGGAAINGWRTLPTRLSLAGGSSRWVAALCC